MVTAYIDQLAYDTRAGGGNTTILRADARNLPLGDNTVDLVVTSPPYFALRSYTDCGEHYAGQVGAEPTPPEYVDALIECTREMVRVLKPSGSIWVNLGDKYVADNRGSGADRKRGEAKHAPRGAAGFVGRDVARQKSLMGLPWRYALRCIDDLGLILRAEVIWAKPNGLPESVTDRVRRSHEQWFHFTLGPRYYSAVDRIREPASGYKRSTARRDTPKGQRPRTMADTCNPLGKLPGSVWNIPTEPLSAPAHLGVDHYAAFPTGLIRPIILGWSPNEICTACGEGRRQVPTVTGLDESRPQARAALAKARRAGLTEAHLAAVRAVGTSDVGRAAATQTGTGRNTAEVMELAAEAKRVLGGYTREFLLRRPLAFDEACDCPDTSGPTTSGVVLDPFGGTGTTALVAKALGRHGISVDRSADYCRLAEWRTNDPAQLAKAAALPKPQVQIDNQASLFDEFEAAS